MNSLEQACADIITKNMGYTDETLYLLYDTESPLARELSDAYIHVLKSFADAKNPIIIREFKNPPQPLYRGGMVNPENPHAEKQNRVITSHNIEENKRVGLNHHEVFEVKTTEDTSLSSVMSNPEQMLHPSAGQKQQELSSGQDFSLHSKGQVQSGQQEHGLLRASQGQEQVIEHGGLSLEKLGTGSASQGQEQSGVEGVDPQIESIKNELISLPKGSIVILVQSTNFRLSTFRIRLELFHRGIHVVEHNHLAYIPEEQFPTFHRSLEYRTPEYVRMEKAFLDLIEKNNLNTEHTPPEANLGTTRVVSMNGDVLTFGPLENIRGNTGDYSSVENKGGTFPIGEVFTEAIDLDHVNGKCWVDTFPNEDFSIAIVEPFCLEIQDGRVLPSEHFPAGFQKLYNWVVQYEGEVRVRELGFGLNPAISTATPLHDINFHERKVGVHLSLGKKHGIYGKKLPKTEVQRFHIDVFVALESVFIGETQVFRDGQWVV